MAGKLTVIETPLERRAYDAEQEAAWRTWWDNCRDDEIEALRALIKIDCRERLAFRAGWLAGRQALKEQADGPQ